MSQCKVLHVVPHLGGGVGRCLSSLFEICRNDVYREVLLLEQPIDHKYEKKISKKCKVKIIDWEADLGKYISQFDLVQIEFWNHPATMHFLYDTQDYAFKRIFWCHISGNGHIKFPINFLRSPETIVFSSNQSNVRYGLRRKVINSGFGFARRLSTLTPHNKRKFDFVFAGQLDFRKMHHDLIYILDFAGSLTKKPFYILGDGLDRDFIKKNVTSPSLEFLGHVSDIERYLENTKFLIYPLKKNHYGTGENIIKEAMSLGCIPLLLDNDVELEIAKDFGSNICFNSLFEMKENLWNFIDVDNAKKLLEISSALKLFSDAEYSPQLSARQFYSLYMSVKDTEKSTFRMHDFFGSTVFDWYNAFTASGHCNTEVEKDYSESPSKGSLRHFHEYFKNRQIKGKINV